MTTPAPRATVTGSGRLTASPVGFLVLLALGGGIVAGVAVNALAPAAGEWMALVVFVAAAVPLAFIDALTFRLPNRGTLPLAAGMLGYWAGIAIQTAAWENLVRAILAGIALAATGLVISLIGTLAFGDVKLLLSIGLLTGWFTWLLPFSALVAAYFLALPHATVLLLRRRRTHGGSTNLPFGPYLLAGAVICTAITLLS